VKANGELKCPTCRCVVESWEEKHVVANLKRKCPQAAEPDDPRYRWAVAYIAGIRTDEAVPGRGRKVEYKVVFSSPEFRAGAAAYEWMGANQMDSSVNIDEFHSRYEIPSPDVLGFPWGIEWEFDLPKSVKVRGRETFKCPHARCKYTNEKRSNVDVHIVCVHQRCPFLLCPLCSSVEGSRSNLKRHFQRCANRHA
jgi:hypothetical protein